MSKKDGKEGHPFHKVVAYRYFRADPAPNNPPAMDGFIVEAHSDEDRAAAVHALRKAADAMESGGEVVSGGIMILPRDDGTVIIDSDMVMRCDTTSEGE